MNLEAFKHWPDVCDVSTYTPKLSVGALLQDQKLLLWRHLKIVHPEKAKELGVIMNDPAVLELLEHFGGELLIEERYVPDALRWLIR